MRIALISDIHGNRVALDAVLQAIEQQAVDQIVCLGDVATMGPRPLEVVEQLRSIGCPIIMGNHDQFILEPELVYSYSEAPPVIAAVDWCREQLGDAQIEFIKTFQAGLTIELADGVTLQLYHGSPLSNMEELTSTTPAERLDTLFDGSNATVVAGGHTHFQMLRQHCGLLMVNPGSVGMPFEQRNPSLGGPPVVMSHAEYAVIKMEGGEIKVELCRVTLDRTMLLAETRANPHPMGDFLAQVYG